MVASVLAGIPFALDNDVVQLSIFKSSFQLVGAGVRFQTVDQRLRVLLEYGEARFRVPRGQDRAGDDRDQRMSLSEGLATQRPSQ